MSEIKKSTVYFFNVGSYEFRFKEDKEVLYLEKKGSIGYDKINIPLALLKEALKKVEEFK